MFRYAEIKQVKDKIEWEIKNFGKQTKMERQHTKTYRIVQKQFERDIYSDK